MVEFEIAKEVIDAWEILIIGLTGLVGIGTLVWGCASFGFESRKTCLTSIAVGLVFAFICATLVGIHQHRSATSITHETQVEH